MAVSNRYQITLNSINRVEKILSDRLDRIVLGTFMEIRDNIVVGGDYSPGTPIDRGFARLSWWEGVNEVGSPVQPSVPKDKSEGALPPPPLNTVIGKAGDIFYLSSNCAYINRLEYDFHSSQAPAGFVRLTLMGFQEIFDSWVRATK